MATAMAALAPAGAAHASITTPVVVAGPDPSIVEVGQVALASDGTGGVIYRRAEQTGSHIYVARVANGRWTGSQRVDTSLPYGSFEPRLAAGAGGRLVAVWAQDYAHRGATTLYRLYSSQIVPGARTFETPVVIDRDIGDPAGTADDVDPSLAMNDGGVAFVAYRKVKGTNPGAQPGRSGDTVSEFRVARMNGGTWSGLGPVNRNPAFTVPKAAPENGPRISVDLQGNGVVAFIEPDDGGIERVWARRLFSGRIGLPLKASPQTIGAAPLRGDADAFSLTGGGLGAAAVGVRQQPGLNSPLPGPRIFVTRLAPSIDDGAKEFGTPLQVGDDAIGLSAPAVSIDAKEDLNLAYAVGQTTKLGGVGQRSVGALRTVDDGSATGGPVLASGAGGATITGWPVRRDGLEGVAVEQAVPGQPVAPALLGGVRGGLVSDLTISGSGLGDAAIAFRQGEGFDTQVVAALAEAPPQPFLVYAPEDWVVPKRARFTWERPSTAVGTLRFDVLVDGQVVLRGLPSPWASLPTAGLDDGRHEVVIRATDRAGQSTVSRPVDLQVDGHAPLASASIGRSRELTVRVRDNAGGTSGSGVAKGGTSIRFGDGARMTGQAVIRHRYRRAGRYKLTVRSEDKVGNGRTTVIAVRVP